MTKSKRPRRAQIAQNVTKAIAGLSDGTYKNPNQAVNSTGAPRAKLFRHLHGGKTRREVNIQNQALTPAEESALVSFVKRATALGHPIRHGVPTRISQSIADTSSCRRRFIFTWKRLGDAISST
jgi:hypothetical protein